MLSPVRRIRALLLVALGASACSGGDQLSRAEAQAQLVAKYGSLQQYDFVTTGGDGGGVPTPYFAVQAGTPFPGTGNWRSPFQALLDAGLITITLVASNVAQGLYGQDHYQIEFTDKARPFVVGTEYSLGDRQDKVVTANATSIDILGVTAPANTGGAVVGTVEYRVNWALTEFGHALGKSAVPTLGSESFVKYDDGWRIARQ